MSVLDPELVKSLLGKRMLVGLTYIDANGEVTHQKQFFGLIHSITEELITLRHPLTGAECTLPPFLANCKKASPGEYRLRETGEIVVDPDLLATWEIHTPPKTE